MYENGTVRPVETVSRRGKGEIKEKDGGDESKIYCKNFCKCHNISLVQLQYAKK
jgi:hypothetical protein